jgi:hypothetical protein
MRNPGLTAAYIHPRMENIPRGDPDFDPEEEEGEGSDWVPFSGWRRDPGQPLRTKVGPAFKPGETPEDVIHGEVISPEEQDGADRIINGEHESDQPSDNPDVERAREDLHTPASQDTVSTLSGLLKGGSPEDVGGLDEAHDYLSHHFTGVKANYKRGVLMAQSPAGMQLVKRKMNLPAIPEQEKPEETYVLTNKHGTFESRSADRVVRAMLAFQILHNELADQKKRDDDDSQNGLATTSGLRDFMYGLGDVARGAAGIARGVGNYLNPAKAPGAHVRPSKPTPLTDVPHGAVFEPGRGTDIHPETGLPGGWVAHSAGAPSHWERDPTGRYAISPGHELNIKFNKIMAMTPMRDPDYPGHTFTYAPNPDTGHIYERFGSGTPYFATDLHPAVREGLDRPPKPKGKSKPATRLPTRPPVPPPHNPPRSLGPTDSPLPPSTFGVKHEPDYPDPEWEPPPPHKLSAVQMNDLCPVCASGYLEPYDQDFHECLNCGSLVKHVGFDKQAAARPKGGLGRGLKDIEQPEATKSQSIMDIAHGGSQDPNRQDEPLPTAEYHPLQGEVNQTPEDERYVAPTQLREKGQVRRKQSEFEPITLDEHMGKWGFTPHHKGGDRLYAAPMPGTRNMYMRLAEGAPHPVTGERGWVLSADTFPAKEPFITPSGKPMRGGLPLERTTKDPTQPGKKFNQPLPDLTNRMAGEKSMLASGTHPVHDIDFARAIADVAINGRDSETYQNAVLGRPYTPPPVPLADPFVDQRGNRALSSVRNPGLARFESAS